MIFTGDKDKKHCAIVQSLSLKTTADSYRCKTSTPDGDFPIDMTTGGRILLCYVWSRNLSGVIGTSFIEFNRRRCTLG